MKPPETELLLGLDAGGSSTKWGLFRQDGTLLRQGRAAAMTGHLFSSSDTDRLQTFLTQLHADVQTPVAAVVAGVSGLQVGALPLLRAALSETFAVPDAQIRVTDDMELAYAAHFLPGEGVLVYAGTGSIAYHRTRAGEVLRAGGHGFLLGDEGGAFWQGQQALRAVLAVQDAGRLPEGPLARELEAVTGSLAWPQVRRWVYEGGRAALATLAPALHRAALLNDPAALDVTRRAGAALVALARTLLGRCPPGTPLSLCGGAANDLIRAEFSAALPDVVTLLPRAPLLGAPRLSPLSHLSPSLEESRA
ncbi:ATPase (plasmid) [Deinococcus sp. KNUC1210]|uniref:N-acetylglucosamine kinase n=1 Tax=Deinococcus sp. KNUC1210 TaxID=2917691 RepID=UPI001EEFD883|nr:BadF/BadG/BcrA/BcrD ATPase family protein [Deinococcus sp. KNUC1210]ULH14207.1 ATPase [Deinococcus sp. KNUC1210]